jgi:hypothetical protein
MKGLVALVVVPLAALAFVHVATTLMPEPTPAQTMYPQSVLWAGRVFTSKAEFARWLRRHDESYAHWVRMHPGASPWESRPATPIPSADRDGGGLDLRRGLPFLFIGLLAAGLALAIRARGVLVSAVSAPVAALTMPSVRAPDARGLANRVAAALPQSHPAPPPLPAPSVVVAEEYDDTPPVPGEVFCEIAFWRGYVKGQFLARLSDVDGSPVIARSHFFRTHRAPPERTPEAEQALAGLLEWLDRDGWRAYGARGPWYSRWYVGRWPSGPPLRTADPTR